ncbi:MAG: GNAT family N-acetyltransferase [Symbiobacterium sp.]|uniref:GNAT family N-acetyltransferase n=1 Tax=Symbiobacterium sp. TaxID=1971213 RepID=UPI0034638C5F
MGTALTDPDRVLGLMAAQGGELIGYASARPDPAYPPEWAYWRIGLGVRPDHRRGVRRPGPEAARLPPGNHRHAGGE